MSKRPTRSPGIGPIDERSVYPLTVFTKRLGLCRHSLMALRRQGLPVRIIGERRLFIDGKEAVDFLRRQWAGNGTADAQGGEGKASD
jgi:hypothetical protein